MDSALIRKYITNHDTLAKKYKALYNRYKIESVPIQTRTLPAYIETETITRLNNDFFSEIVDTKTGYMGAIPIKYSVTEDHPDREKVLIDLNYINEKCNMPDIDAETVKMSAICGVSYRLLYIDEDGQPSVMNVDPWEIIPIKKSRTGNEIIEAIRYFTETRTVDGKDTDLICVEYYTKDKISFWVEKSPAGEFVPDTYLVDQKYVKDTVIENFFPDVPVVEFPNNKEMLADAAKVLTLIDDYDFTLSDQSTELKQFAQAYMKVIGASFSEETRKAARKTGCIEVPSGCDVSFIEKTMNIEAIKDQREEMKKNIARFASHVDFTNNELYGHLTQMAIFVRLLALESKCIVFERKMVKSLKRQWRLLSEVIKKTGSEIDPLKMDFTFTRSLPVNISDIADTYLKLRQANYPVEEALKLLSFVKDPKAVYEKYLKEQQELFGTVPIDGTTEPTKTEEVKPVVE